MSDPKVQLTGNITYSIQPVDSFTTAPSSYLEWVSSCEFTRPFHSNHCTFSESGNQELFNFLELECRQIVKPEPKHFCYGQKTWFPLYDCTLCRNWNPPIFKKSLCRNGFSFSKKVQLFWCQNFHIWTWLTKLKMKNPEHFHWKLPIYAVLFCLFFCRSRTFLLSSITCLQ